MDPYLSLWSDSITIGPAAVPFALAALVIGWAVSALVLRIVWRSEPNRHSSVWDALSTAAFLGFVGWKAAPLIHYFDRIRLDPVLILRMPGGRIGIVLGAFTTLSWMVWRVMRTAPNARIRFALDAAVAVALLAGATALVPAGALLIRSDAPRALRFADDSKPTVPPELSLAVLDAPSLSFSELRGTPVVLSFWASWCGPCRAEFPHKVRFYHEFGEQIAFVAVNATNTEPNVETVRRYARDNDLPFRIALDAHGEMARSFAVRGTPTTVLIDAQGRIVARWFGPVSYDRLASAVRTILQRSSE